MALASLCSRTNLAEGIKPSFTAFIVDHSLRQSSDEEARKVSQILKQLNIESMILKLDWSQSKRDPSRLTNMETMARTLRYQAIGRACRDLKIESLLLGHHADDHAETIMGRLIGGYTGFGLRGIRPNMNIPECHGIYGVSESGSPRVLKPLHPESNIFGPLTIENGGISIHRPLLRHPKQKLMGLCTKRGVEWFEDPTNADESLTSRNTIRHLWKESRLPAALSKYVMIGVARTVEARFDKHEALARGLYNDLIMRIDVRSGRLIVILPPGVVSYISRPRMPSHMLEPSMLDEDVQVIATMLLRMVFMLVTPRAGIELTALRPLAWAMFPDMCEGSSSALGSISNSLPSVAGLATRRATRSQGLKKHHSGKKAKPTNMIDMSTFIIHREKPHRTQVASISKVLLESHHQRPISTDLTWTDWQLFDGRFWIRLRHRPWNLAPNRAIVIRLMTQTDSPQLQKLHDSQGGLNDLIHKLDAIGPAQDCTGMPVIVEQWETIGPKYRIEVEEEICAFPTLNWGKKGWSMWEGQDSSESPWSWEWRYKKIDYGEGKKHEYDMASAVVATR